MGGRASNTRMIELARYIEDLEVTQGAGLGGRFGLLPWERRFLRRAVLPQASVGGCHVTCSRARV